MLETPRVDSELENEPESKEVDPEMAAILHKNEIIDVKNRAVDRIQALEGMEREVCKGLHVAGLRNFFELEKKMYYFEKDKDLKEELKELIATYNHKKEEIREDEKRELEQLESKRKGGVNKKLGKFRQEMENI